MSFGPWPRRCAAIGAPMKATKKRQTMKMAPAIASLSFLRRSQMPSQ